MTHLRPCPTCGTPTRNTHCLTHQPPRRRRDYGDETARRRILTDWRQRIGDWCPGSKWCNPAGHPSTDLTVDHLRARSKGGRLTDGWRILCRTANSRRGTGTGGGGGHTATPTPPQSAPTYKGIDVYGMGEA